MITIIVRSFHRTICAKPSPRLSTNKKKIATQTWNKNQFKGKIPMLN